MMNITALAAETAKDYAVNADWGRAFSADRISLAITVTIVGMLMIFAVLAVLWLVLTASKFIFAGSAAVKKTEAPAASAPKAPVKTAPEQKAQPKAMADDGELVAIITAAVAAYRAAENGGTAPTGFRVVSYRRANGGKAWNSK